MGELGASPVQRLLGDLSRGHVLNGADEHGSTGDSFDHVADGVEMLHVSSRRDDAEGHVEADSFHGALVFGVVRRQVLGVDDPRIVCNVTLVAGSNSKMRKVSSDQSRSSATKSVMKLPVLLSR